MRDYNYRKKKAFFLFCFFDLNPEDFTHIHIYFFFFLEMTYAEVDTQPSLTNH